MVDINQVMLVCVGQQEVSGGPNDSCSLCLPLSLTGSASRTDLSQLANGIWEIHAGCPSFLRVSSVAKIGYIPQFKASNARDQDEVSSDLARMLCLLTLHYLV